MATRDRHAELCRQSRPALRKAAAAVELAMLLPFLLIIFVAAVDFGRVFYNAQVITDCARTTALFVANPDLSDQTVHESAMDLAMQYVKDLKPQPSVNITTGVDGLSHAYVEVTVSQDFALISPLAFRSHYNLARTARARLYPAAIDELAGNE